MQEARECEFAIAEEVHDVQEEADGQQNRTGSRHVNSHLEGSTRKVSLNPLPRSTVDRGMRTDGSKKASNARVELHNDVQRNRQSASPLIYYRDNVSHNSRL